MAGEALPQCLHQRAPTPEACVTRAAISFVLAVRAPDRRSCMAVVASQSAPILIQQFVANFDRTRAQHELTTLCAPAFAGRRIGTDGHERAQIWLTETMRALGLAVTTFDFTLEQPVLDLAARPTLEVLDVDGTVLRALLHRREFAEHFRSADCSTRITGLARRWQDEGDVRGVWVVLDSVPQSRELVALAEQLSHQGAAGLLLSQAVGTDGYLIKRVMASSPIELPALTVSAELMPSLIGAQVRASVPIRRVFAAGAHVLGRIAGTDPALENTPLLVGAHYDGVGDDPGGERIPGAADNAAGVAVVLEIARALLHAPAAPRRPIILAAFDGEEINALGSQAYAYYLKQQGLTPLVINLDGAARFNEAVWVEPGAQAGTLVNALDQAGQWLEIPLILGAVGSDNRRYAAQGFQTVGIALGGATGHTPGDVPEQVDLAAVELAGQLLLATIGQLAF
jgi:aminopeptidase YwaD